jgi:uncharacterized membrane protein
MADRFATRLATEIQGWIRDGLLSSEQGTRILARYPAGAGWLSRPAALFGLIGGGLVAAGLALVISHNWESIHRWAKVGGLVVLMLAAHLGALRLRDRGYGRLAEGLFVVGGSLLLVGIGLIGQIYNLVGRPSDAVGLWCLLLLPAAYALPSLALGALAYAGIVGWFFMMLDDPGTALGDAARLVRLFWSVAVVAFGLVLLGIGMLHGDGAYRRLRQALEQAGLAMIFFGFLWFGTKALDGIGHGGCRCASVAIAGWTVLGAVAVVVGARRLPAAPPGARSSCLAMLLVLPLSLGGLEILTATGAPPFAWNILRYAGWAVLFGLSLGLVLFGARWDRPSWINWGVLSLLVQAVVRYLDLFGTMLQTSVLFFSAGALVLILGWVLERTRRRLTADAAGGREAA